MYFNDILFEHSIILILKQGANNINKYIYIGLTDPDNYNNQHQINVFQLVQAKQLQLEERLEEGYKLIVDRALRTKSTMWIDRLIKVLKQGDTIVICGLEYLATSMNRLLARLDSIEAAGATIEVLNIKGNSLAAHANALRDFNKFYRGSKISKTLREQADKNDKNNVIKNTKSSIQSWNEQHSIAVAKNTGKMTVAELAKKHKVSRQSIYRICNKEVFKDAEVFTFNIETWERGRFINTIYADIKRDVEPVLVTITTANKLLELHSYTTDDKYLQRPKAEAEYLDKPAEELDRIFKRAVQKQVKQWKDEEQKEIEENIKKRGEKQQREKDKKKALALKRKKAHEKAIKQMNELALKREREDNTLLNGENNNERD